MVSPFTLCFASSTAPVAGRLSKSPERRGPQLARRSGHHELGPIGEHGTQRALVGGAVVGEDQRRFDALEDVLQRAVFPGLQRVGRSDRRVGHADVHGRQREQRVVDAVARQNDDGPVG